MNNVKWMAMVIGLVVAAAGNAATWEATGDADAQDMHRVSVDAAQPCIYASQLVQPGETVRLTKLDVILACIQTEKGTVFKRVGGGEQPGLAAALVTGIAQGVYEAGASQVEY